MKFNTDHTHLSFLPMTASNVEMSALLEAIATTGKEWSQQEPAAREKLLSLAHSLIAALETPSEFVHRIGIAEVFFHLFIFSFFSFFTQASSKILIIKAGS